MSIITNQINFSRDFTQIPNAWIRDARLSHRARGVLAVLMSHTDGWETTVDHLVRNGAEGRDAIRKAIGELVEVGYLERVEPRGEDGRLAGKRYEIRVPDDSESTNRTPENPTVGKPGPGKPTAGKSGAGESATKKTNLKEDQLKEDQENTPAPGGAVARAPERRAAPAKKNAGEYTPEFLEWWKHYPRKTDKGNAFKAWQKLDGVDVQTLIDGADRYAADPNREARFTKHPATWLNARSWEDEDPLPARGARSWRPSNTERLDDGMDMVRRAQQMQAEQDRKELA